MATLTPKQRSFVDAYLSNGRNACEAYRKAYNTKATPNTIAVEANRLLGHPKIAPILAKADQRAEKATARAIDQYEVTQERVTRELALLGFANMLDYMTTDDLGDPVLDFSKLTREQAAALTEVTVEDFKDGRGESARDVRRIKFKLADKRAALVDLGRHLGMFKDRIEHSGPNGGPIEIDSPTERIARRLAGLTAGGSTPSGTG
jgi:phage terminase small subunit